MDLDATLAAAAPARHASVDGPDSPAAAALYQRITAAPPPTIRARRRTRILAVGLVATAVAGLAVAATLVLIPGTPAAGPHTPRGTRPQLAAAWSVTKQPDGELLVTVRELRDALGLQRRLRTAGVPANVQFPKHNFIPTTSSSAVPRGCRAPHLSDQASALLQAKIMPIAPDLPLPAGASGGVVITIHPAAIPHGIGVYIKAWVAGPDNFSLQTNLVLVSPQCTGR